MNDASLKDAVSAAEWQLRVDLAACYRLVAVHGWTDLIFTHTRNDLHQDHRLLCELTWNAFRTFWRWPSSVRASSLPASW